MDGDAKRASDGTDGQGVPNPKRPRSLPRAKTHEEELDDLIASGLLDEPSDPPEEIARQTFADNFSSKGFRVQEEDLPKLLAEVMEKGPEWGGTRYWRCAALFVGCMARSTRSCRIAFVAHPKGLSLMGLVLKEAVSRLEAPGSHHEASMLALACLTCLKALPLGRASLWEHRQAIGKPFDQLHKWCAKDRSAIAAELRGPTLELCQRWKRQPKPAAQEQTHKALRGKVLELISSGLHGRGTSPSASPAPMSSPAQLPGNLVAAEVESALWGRYGASKTAEYRHHARMLRANLALPGNGELRARVLAGDLKAEELVSMDSGALAPDEIQRQRREVQLQAMKEAVVEDLQPVRPEDGEGSPFDPGADLNTAPLVWRSPTKDTKQESQESQGDQEEVATGLPMVPPPTPFRLSVATPTMEPATSDMPEMLATPGPDDEDDDLMAVLRFLASSP
ncbi:YSA1 [Symbiodinium necroappetens]|uniref:YSA1 protein n=1 Tax=Symbiodinium necroappetens TaxID=1628268 RepID=A0A812YGY9_9DINO|nr:YSA1 [Symbiodinium sp. KB8]CAE7781934.1 YSA1 [Symbiodinium necroappetens]